MSGLTGLELYTLVFVVVIAVIVVGLMLYLLQLLRRRRSKLLGDLDQHPAAIRDRAFNRLAMARREAHILSDNGVDVHRAEELVGESQGAFDTGQFDRSYELAQSAHEALVNARRQGARTTDAPLPTSGTSPSHSSEPAAATAAVSSPGASSGPEAPRPAIPKNRAESQFQIRLLTEELAALPPKRAREQSGVQAAQLNRKANQAFDQGDFTEAFRLALRGRRALGGHLETLPPSPTHATAGAAPGMGNGTAANPPDLAATAESVAGGERCTECGYPALPGDAFCRGCGKPRGPMTCPSCGSPRAADEPFCGRCGTRFP
ncbi:MAG TPA: zinc ribbon domain-containing protein [Thermoplasmata archaeon]|nr:zinc ribbon domain-containing protein [Thermoplasmata archaeon]